MSKRITSIVMLALFSTLPIFSTAQESLEYDYGEIIGYAPDNYDRKVIPWRNQREAGAKYVKRIHRIIDVREKQNLPMNWPKSPFYKLIYEAVTKRDNKGGIVRAYKSDSLDLGSWYTINEVKERGTDSVLVSVPAVGGGTDDVMYAVPFDSSTIVKYRIMEEWLFDFDHSDFKPRIIAIAPIFNLTTSGIPIGEAKLFWVKMEDLRPTLVNHKVFNPFNEGAMLNFDSWFEMRMFSSYIIKEENVWDYDLPWYPEHEDNSFAALLASEKIKNDLFVFEHDLWEY